jgi:hypothetical protein
VKNLNKNGLLEKCVLRSGVILHSRLILDKKPIPRSGRFQDGSLGVRLDVRNLFITTLARASATSTNLNTVYIRRIY